MSIYNCPHCGEKTFTPLTKAFAGQLNSKGKPCKKCGKRCVNGKGATIFNCIFSVAVFAAVIAVYLIWPAHDILIVIGLIASLFVVPKLVNAFFFKMAEAIRIDLP